MCVRVHVYKVWNSIGSVGVLELELIYISSSIEKGTVSNSDLVGACDIDVYARWAIDAGRANA